ncbi:MAG: lipopolysaccharide transport periplasmic protein LptA [Deltaproteobacteria bacterium]|jgi:lipopolysaccharide export system protein LptA|nr:lipopolysaccharide transport periplasmic protein LptA [Deltaproteobacteria bacterium]
MMIRLNLFFVLSCLAAGLLLPAGLQAEALSGPSPQPPIHIEADKMISGEKERAGVFVGRVKATQGELMINSDEMTVYHAEPGGAKPAGEQAQPQIQRMHAKGHVEIIQADFVATGDEAEYFSGTGKVIITGNAKIIQNNNMVTGHRVEMDLAKGSTVIVPDKEKDGRVVGYFYPAKGVEDDADADAAEESPAAGDQQQEDADHGDAGN